ncbi:MAG: cephalosporin hydroxylase family protein [Elusimicrobia bacterium]|nr:cephalosporin hydroxylase family protein [Elusimicrobiota bacterium]
MTKKLPDPIEQFNRERVARIASYKDDKQLQEAAHAFMKEIVRTNYIFNFSWLGRPVIQLPQDLFAMQEIIWTVKPDFIIETGIAHGGSLIFQASMLELLGKGTAIGIDIDIRKHNRREIERHPLSRRIKMIKGSSVDDTVVSQVKKITAGAKSLMVTLDSNHTHEHVLKELQLYTPLVSLGSYCIVGDTAVEDFSREIPIVDRAWGPGDNPKTAVREFLRTHDEFEIDKDIESKLFLTGAPDGYLKRIK